MFTHFQHDNIIHHDKTKDVREASRTRMCAIVRMRVMGKRKGARQCRQLDPACCKPSPCILLVLPTKAVVTLELKARTVPRCAA